MAMLSQGHRLCYKLRAVSSPSRLRASSAPKEFVPGGENPPAAQTARGSNPSAYCPACSRPLVSQKCKLICEACGYYMSCSDFY